METAGGSGMPPPFGEQAYWDNRFRENTEPYDWLQEPSILDKEITEALRNSDVPTPQILHIGCGTSLLSFHLRAHVDDPRQVQNIDFSAEAVNWGREREKQIFDFQLDDEDFENQSEEDERDEEETEQLRQSAMEVPEIPMMRWTQTSLLSLPEVISTCQLGGYSVIVDSTYVSNTTSS
jgi:SAM-dependent methyltransferase